MMDPVLAPFTKLVGEARANPPEIPFLSNRTGTWISGHEAADASYWAGQLRETVQFDAGVQELLSDSERILLEAVRAGGDRQDLHEKIRVHARASADRLKEGADDCDLFERLQGDAAFGAVHEHLTVEADLSGRAGRQVEEFLAAEVDPVLKQRSELLGGSPEVSV